MALIKRLRLSLGVDQREQHLRDCEQLSLEKYVDELAGATAEGIGKCKTERDVWAATEVSDSLFLHFQKLY
jgi:regulator of nonsense transcripts 2